MATSEELADPELLPKGDAVRVTRSTASQFHRIEVDGKIDISLVPIEGQEEVIVRLYNGEKGDLKTVVDGDVLVISDVRPDHATMTPPSTIIGSLVVRGGNVVIGHGSTQNNYYNREQARPREEAQQALRVVVQLPPELNIKICYLDGAVGVTGNMTTGAVSAPHYVAVTMQEGELIRR